MEPSRRWTPDALRAQSKRFERASPQAVLRWGRSSFPRVAQGTGFGPSGIALMHMLTRQSAHVGEDAVTFFFLDTGVLFDETYALRERLEARLGVDIVAVESRVSLRDQGNVCGPSLWDRAPDQCCHLRKVRPLRRFLKGYDAWITGVRRDQGPSRQDADRMEWDDGNELVKLNPLAPWTREQVWAYLRRHDLPYNPLHDQGYPSIGCQPCTQPASTENDLRAGRWADQDKTECGIHLSDNDSLRERVG